MPLNIKLCLNLLPYKTETSDKNGWATFFLHCSTLVHHNCKPQAVTGCLLANAMPFSMLAFNSGLRASKALASYSVSPWRSEGITA